MPRMTRQRKAITEAFEKANRPLSPTEVLDLARDEVPNLGLSTVYRSLRLMAEQGEIAVVELPGELPGELLPANRETADAHSQYSHRGIPARLQGV